MTTTSSTDAARGQAAREQRLTDEVVASFAACHDPRLRQVMQSLTRHLHAFLRDVRLTEDHLGLAGAPRHDC